MFILDVNILKEEKRNIFIKGIRNTAHFASVVYYFNYDTDVLIVKF